MNDAKDGMVKVGTFEPMGRGDVYVSEELLAQRGVEVVRLMVQQELDAFCRNGRPSIYKGPEKQP